MSEESYFETIRERGSYRFFVWRKWKGQKMKIMGIDTSTSSLSIALMVDGALKYELIQNHALTHSERLLPYIRQMMEASDCQMQEIDKFACCVGPGSFTGVRIGVSVANAFAMATGKPVVAVSTLEAMAYSHRFSQKVILATTDAQRGNFYAAMYQAEDKGKLISVEDEHVFSTEELAEKISCYKEVILTGDAVGLWKEVPDNVELSSTELCYPRASSICLIAKDKKEEQRYIEPVYLRKSQAELQFEERMEKKR